MVAVSRLTFYVLRFCVRDVLQWALEREMMNDEERAAWEVPSLTAALALGEALTRDNPPAASATHGLPLTAHIEEESSS